MSVCLFHHCLQCELQSLQLNMRILLTACQERRKGSWFLPILLRKNIDACLESLEAIVTEKSQHGFHNPILPKHQAWVLNFAKK